MIITLEAAFWGGACFGAIVVITCIAIGSLIGSIVVNATTCKKCGKPKKECKCNEKAPTKRELMKEIKEFQKKQEIEKLKERLEILKKGE
jgi:hypothetical protein